MYHEYIATTPEQYRVLLGKPLECIDDVQGVILRVIDESFEDSTYTNTSFKVIPEAKIELVACKRTLERAQDLATQLNAVSRESAKYFNK